MKTLPLVRSAVPCLALLTATTACVHAPGAALRELALPAATTQVVLSTTAGWDDTAATVRCLERDGDGWRQVGAAIPARVGRSGLGWGLGLHADGDGGGPTKREGDGRAPAGVFALGPAFGYADAPPPGLAMPYRRATARDYFVDDPESPAYNTWQRIPDDRPNEPADHWRSCERMRRDDAQYELGVVVGHNTDAPVPGRGSAIFVHVWSAPDEATSGCTAMARSDLERVLAWLRADAEPVLVQAPSDALAELRVARAR